MADKKKAEAKSPDKKDKKAEKADKAANPKAAGKRNATIFMVGIIVMAAVFLPSSILLAVGMMPTFTVLFVDPYRARTKVVTVGALNLAGCVPFLLELWKDGHSIDKALGIIADPKAIIVMYSAAAIGYLVDWSMSGVVAAILYQRGQARQEAIRKRQEELVARWGMEVTGQVPLDQYGFPIDSEDKD
jgi:hypothetical protein